MKSKLIWVGLCLFLIINSNLKAQMKRVLLNPNGTTATSFRNNSTATTNNNTTSCLVETILLTTQAAIDTFSTAYPTCTTPKYLIIDGSGASPAITNLSGLSSITQVLNKLKISHTSITSLSALTNLTQIGDTLQLEYNDLLTSIGLNNLTNLGGLYFKALPVLNSLAGLSNHITTIGPVHFDSTLALSDLSGLSNITRINGSLEILFAPITNLNSLNNIDSIQGLLYLEKDTSMTSIGLTNLKICYFFLLGNLPHLTSIAGLTYKLINTNTGTFWINNTALTDLTGLDSLVSVPNFYISANQNLVSLHGLEKLSGDAGGGISIYYNPVLTDISALSNINNISEGTLDIDYNYALPNLTGLGNILNIGGGLWIESNSLLTTLSDLNSNLIIHNNSINSDHFDSVRINNNTLLALCSFGPLCNYLNVDGRAEIGNNAIGCNSIAEIKASCNVCTGVLKTWTGAIDTDWDNADNWSPAAVPLSCDTVYISTGLFNYPEANSNITIHGLIMEGAMNASASISLGSFSLTNYGTVQLDEAQILMGNNISFINAVNPHIFYSLLQADNTTITGYTGSLNLFDNNINGNLILNDSTDRLGPNNINANSITGGDLTISTNSTAVTAETLIGNDNGNYVYGHVTFNINAPVLFNAANINIDNDLTLNSNVDSQYIVLDAITFKGGMESHIKQLGTTPVTIGNLYTEKNSPQAYIIPEQNIFIRNNVQFFIGIIKTTPTKLIIFNDGSGINQTSSASWVWGPIKKIGSEQFTFPVGDSLRQAILTILSPGLSTDAYTAQYFHNNPTNAGYDTALHVSSLSQISGAEYWTLNRDAGSSNVFVSLSYDSTRSSQTGSIYSLRVSQWSPGQWQNKGSIFLSGDLSWATLTSAGPITDYDQPLTLGYIEPPIIPVITVGNMDSIICRGNSFKVRFTVDTLMFSGNNFIAQLSDSTGSFSNPTNIGTIFGVNHSDSITTSIPSNTPLSNFYRVRVIGISPPDTSINSKPLSIRTVPLLSFTIQGSNPGCISSGIHKYYASQKEPGVNYSWILSGGSTFTTNGDTAYVTWITPGTYTITLHTSNLCGNGPSANRQITVGYPAPNATPTINNTGRWIYSSQAPVNATYQWYRNGSIIAGSNNASYYASLAGDYTQRFTNLCGSGPVSNSISFAANSIPQTINFPAIANMTYGDESFVPNATATSGLPVSLTLISGPATINAQTNFLTIIGTGLVTVKANQIGDHVYDTAVPVTRSFTVNKAAQLITFPSISEQDITNVTVTLIASTTSALPISYSIVSGPASVSDNLITITGLGMVIVRASQIGDTNYLSATAVNRSFCTRVNSLNPISGYTNLCPGTATYTVNNIAGATYFWRILGGSTLASTANSVNVTWTTPGTYSLLVSASGSCGAASANDTISVTMINSILPDSVQSMYPPNGAINQQLPLTLSWVPAQPNNFYTFDLYVWRSDLAQPGTPFVANLTAVNYTLPLNSGLAYNQTYKWMIVSHNGSCTQINTGPIQQFSLIPLPDLVVQNVQAPTTAFSGQTISINWTVRNPGPGKTTTNQNWTDGVFLTFDTIPNFSIPPQTNPALWGQSDFPSRPLLIAAKPNVSALDSGQQYSNSINFTLPVNYSLPLYAYVITNYPSRATAPVQVTHVNDTARAPQPIVVTLSPTPDLRVDTVFTPTTTFSGSTINLTYKVKNYGVLTPSGAVWTDKVYISQSPLFNLNTAIAIKSPKANGTYYTDAINAAARNSNQLLADSVYTRSMQVVIPNFIYGTYFMYVLANEGDTLYEGALNNNNINRSQLQVFLTPTPHLTVSSLTVPVAAASTTQPIGVNWNINNTGFTDNIEKNKGHYFVTHSTCTVPGTTTQGIAVTDSTGFGSSYWVDRVYLSTDGSSLDINNATLVNESNQGQFNSGMNVPEDPIIFPCQPVGNIISQFNLNVSNTIKTNSNHPNSGNFSIPSTLSAGNYYVYVLANASKSVFEYPGTPETRRSTLPINIQRPDVTLPTVSVPANTVGGQPISINYSVLNNGPGTVFNHVRRDKFYVSTAAVFNGTAQLLDSSTFTEDLPVGTSMPHTFNYTFPVSTSGTRYFYVHTNYDSAFRETNANNNISVAASTIVASAAPSDLVVSNIQMADTIYSVFAANLKYTIANIGSGATSGTWKDSIFISCSPTFNQATSYYITKRSQSEIVPGGSSYTDSFNINIPFAFNINNCFPKTNINTAYFFIKTNADNIVYEGSNGNNNVTGSGSRVIINPVVDHIVTAVTAPDTAIVARPYITNWTVKNIGYNPGTGNYSSWYDAIYFSPDSIFNSNAVAAAGYAEFTTLNTNQVYSDSRSVIPPNIPTGDYYVMANSNYYPPIGIAHEIVLNNNTNLIRNGAGAAKKIHVIQPLLPDLTDSIITAPALVAVGQPLTVIHTVNNKGTGVTYPANWSNDVWLSTDFIPGNAGDIQLSARNHVGALQPNQSYNDTTTVTIALNMLPGNYVLISRVNSTNNVFESNSTNNLALKYVTIYSPAPSDLIVENIMKPDSVFLGYTLDTAQWVIKNMASNAANGVSSDGIYLSKSTTLDSTAILLGIKNKTINLAPLERDTISLTPLVNNVTEGNYNVIVKTDLLNNIVESDKNNNTGIAVSQLYVGVKELPLNVLMPNTLHTISRFYKLVIPDSLSGATIQIVLKSGDSLTMKNQLFAGKDYIPSAAHFDYTYSTPNYGNQDILMTSVTAGIYYITVKCASANPVIQNITLKAIKLPFTILNVQSSSGGNSGNVTIKISGSLFVNNMTALLSKPGTNIHASAVYFTNSTEVYATFNLQGKPLGVYDVSLTKPDTTIATLANGFSIVNPNNGGLITGGGVNTGAGNGNEPGCDPGAASGLNAQLIAEIVTPDRVLIGWPFVIQINYNNPSNVDIPVQARTLYSDHNVLLSLTPQGVANGTTSLYLELTEQNGPPGIIRAGGSGSILIYSKMYVGIPRNTMVHFNLK